jgi:hypothetical protein
MDEGQTERLWPARLRWRWRGARQWPAFAIAVVVDAVLLHQLPVAGDGTGLVGAALLAGFFNLAAVAVLGRLGGRWLRLRRPSLPLLVAEDSAGTAAICSITALLLVAGLVHRPAVLDAQADFRAQEQAVRRYLVSKAPLEYRLNSGHLNTWKQAPHLYRTCVSGPDPRKALCLIVMTDRSPPRVARDPDQRPNGS